MTGDATTAGGAPSSVMTSSSPDRATLVLLGLILVAAVANLNLAVANVALPDIGKAFDASQTALDLVAVGYSLGLVLVVVAGAELFTGNNLMAIAFASRRIRLRALLRAWGVVYVANFIGALTTALIVYFSGHTRNVPDVGRRALEIAATKTSLPFGQAILLGVLANALVCLAVWLAMSARSVTDKIVAIVLPVAAFVAASFEHSIANMYFIPTGLFLKAWAPDSFFVRSGVKPSQYGNLTWSRFFLDNLVPVTIGNVIGGAGLVALVYWYVYRRGVRDAG